MQSYGMTRLAFAAPLFVALAACNVAAEGPEGSPEAGEQEAASVGAEGVASTTLEITRTAAAVFQELPPVSEIPEEQPIADPSVYRAIEVLDDEAVFRARNASITTLKATGRIDIPKEIRTR